MWIGGAGSDDEEDENDEYYTDTFDDVDAATNAALAESLREMDAESTAAAAPPVQAPTASTAADPVAPPIHRAAADPAVPPLHEIGSVRSAVPRSPGPSPGPIRIWGVECRPISSIPGMAPGEARARGGATRNNDDAARAALRPEVEAEIAACRAEREIALRRAVEAKAREADVCPLCHARTPGDPCRVCGHGSAATTDDAAAAADAADSPTSLEALRAAGIPPPPLQPRESTDLPGFAPARFRSSSPLHDDAAALRERSAADARAEADLES